MTLLFALILTADGGGDAPVEGALTGAAVTDAIKAHQPDVVRCIEAEIRRGTKSGRVVSSFQISREGKVVSVDITPEPRFKITQTFLGCLRHVILGVRFPSAEGPTRVSTPFVWSGP